MKEIERKFTVKNTSFLNDYVAKHKIIQGYLSENINSAVRIRIKNNKAFITIKGKSNQTGTTRFEWEKEITVSEAQELLNLCDKKIEKTRYDIKINNHIIEVDVFEKENEGLIIAEIELINEDEHITLPNWIDEEVTGNEKYYNLYLLNNPYKYWKK